MARTLRSRELVHTLNNRERFGELARFFATKSAREADHERFGDYLKAGLDLLTRASAVPGEGKLSVAARLDARY